MNCWHGHFELGRVSERDGERNGETNSMCVYCLVYACFLWVGCIVCWWDFIFWSVCTLHTTLSRAGTHAVPALTYSPVCWCLLFPLLLYLQVTIASCFHLPI